jgi:hypothetical protein
MYNRKKIKIHITTQDNGLFHADCGTYEVKDVKPTELEYIYMPYAGDHAITIDVTGDNKEVVNEVMNHLQDNTKLFPLLNAHHPILDNLFKNIVNSFTCGALEINDLKNILTANEPVLFVGAGPSLLKHMDFIRDVISTKSALVIAGGSANRILDNNGIRPHFALAFDPHESEFEAIGSLSMDYIIQVPLICTYGLHSKVFNLPWKNRYVCPSGSFKELSASLEPHLDVINEGCSGVSTMAINLISYLGSTNVTLIGVDVRYSDDNRLYADSEPLEHTEGIDHLSINDKMIPTKKIWINEAHYILNQAKSLGLKLTVNEESMLYDMGVSSYREDDIMEITIVEPIFKCSDGKRILSLDCAKVIESLEEILRGLDLVEKGVIDPKLYDTEVYSTLLRSWDLMQQFREVRGCGYNHSLIELLVERMRRLINEALSPH